MRGAPAHRGGGIPRLSPSPTPSGNPVVVTVDRGDERSRVALRTAITSASQAPGVIPMTLGGVATRLPARRRDRRCRRSTRREWPRHPPCSPRRPSSAGSRRSSTTPRCSPDPSAPRSCSCSGSPGCRIRSSGRPPSTEHRAATATTLDSVGILPPSPINLFSAGAPIPIWVRNDLPYPVNVVLYATPDDLRLDVRQGDRGHRRPAEQHARRRCRCSRGSATAR